MKKKGPPVWNRKVSGFRRVMLIHSRQSIFHKQVRNKSKFISKIDICIIINAKSEISVENKERVLFPQKCAILII